MLNSRTLLPPRLSAPAAVLVLLLLPSLSPLLAAPSPASPGAEAHALTLLPSAADLVIWVDYSSLRKSELVSEMEARIDALPEAAEHYREFVSETGLDPRQDTDQILMSLSRLDRSAPDGFLLVAQGRFGASRLVETAAAKGGSVTTTSHGTKIWSSRERPGGGNDPAQGKTILALAQVAPEMLLFGSEEEVLRATEVAIRAKSPATREPRLRDLLSGLQHKAPLWAVLNSQGLARQISSEIARSNGDWKPGDALSTVDSVRLMAWAGKDLDLKILVDAKDRESAGLLADLFRGLVAGGKLSAKDSDPELLRILQEMSILEAGTSVEMKVRIPGSRLRLPEGEAPAK